MTAVGWRDLGADVRGAVALLTRLPFGGPGRGAASAWAWPVAGALVGAVAGAVAVGAAAVGVPAGVAAAAVIGVQAMVTGGLHEDGLADTADGLWGGQTVARRLEIMKDPRIGTFGVLALLTVGLARWAAVSALIATLGSLECFLTLVAVGAASRAPMAAVMWALPNARGAGLAQSIGRPSGATAAAAVALGLLAALPVAGWGAVVAAGVVVAILARTARAKIGGQTGDILGATQQVAEAALLASLARG